MFSTSTQSRQLQLTLKVVAILCGAILLIAATQTGSPSLNVDAFLQFIANQLQSNSQLQWLFGVIFLTVGIFFTPVRVARKQTFVGEKDLSNDAYILYLIDRYRIEKNPVLDQHIACNKIFPSIQDALAYVHLLECPLNFASPSVSSPVSEQVHSSNENPPNPIERNNTESEQLRNPFLDMSQRTDSITAVLWSEAKRQKFIIIAGVILFSLVLGALYYANSNSVRVVPSPLVTIPKEAPLQDAPNSDQVISGSIPAQEVANVSDMRDSSKSLVSIPINERWIGTWVDESSKLKLIVTANLLRLNDEEFTWTGTRPKGVVQCCLAFYEGATNKADLLARISGAQEPGVILKPDAQKTLALVNGLSDGNFKRIVFGDPYLKKYFFIYDQNYVYRISRDLGDKVDVVIEQFKKQE